jgi:hypothetical protein
MDPYVPHVTSFVARAPSSLMFCGERNTHEYLAFCKLIWPMPFPHLNYSALALCFV